MVISDHARLPGIIVRGEEQAFARPQAGMLFYNDEGSENGDLIFGGRRSARGEVVDSGSSLSFDRYDANQLVRLVGVHDRQDRMAGLVVSDSPASAPGHRRIWLGRGDDGAATLALMDAAGRKRLLFQVPAEGDPGLLFLDTQGPWCSASRRLRSSPTGAWRIGRLREFPRHHRRIGAGGQLERQLQNVVGKPAPVQAPGHQAQRAALLLHAGSGQAFGEIRVPCSHLALERTGLAGRRRLALAPQRA